MTQQRTVPVFILSGFLGSGKTTLLGVALQAMKDQGLKPAVVMNELGEVNLDGVAVGQEVPMAEMLDGCICCSVKGDLGLTIQQLMDQEKPDVLFIEATGVAHPMEILDGVTEASLYMKVEIKGVITVVDAVLMKDQLAKATGKTYRLLEEQIRTGDVLVLNKTDLVTEEADLRRIEEALRSWNPHATLVRAVRSQVEPGLFAGMTGASGAVSREDQHGEDCGCGHGSCRSGHEEPGGSAGGTHHGKHEHHHSHSHVMVYTRYLEAPVDSTAFEELIARLPEQVYRAKGVLTFRDTASRYLFQYAYKQSDYMKIMPQANIPDVVVFIGESIPKEELERELKRLEAGAIRQANG
ncbi:CobW family GTP-binding protein [Gorillibacterium sp. sgz5001074]|uniref:CobW family GTP-binding protein n=1 Tax=Gorillibacterium sp. sgz5001074 TaxID=3446695 RepID=UPI003F668C00